MNFSEIKVRLYSSGAEETKNDSDETNEQLAQLHPPFAPTQVEPLHPLIPAAGIEFTLAIAEDDFLRDESSKSVVQAQLPTSEHGFSIQVKHHLANIVLPLQLQGGDALAISKVHMIPFHFSVQQLGVTPEDAVELKPMFTCIAYHSQQLSSV